MNETPSDWEARYRAREDLYGRVGDEAEFALKAAMSEGAVKTHSVTNRVKSLESIRRKAKEKELDDPLAELGDVVGARVVVLFRSDLPRVDELIRRSFEVHSADDKITSGDPASFGYMSIHYQVSFGDQYQGPRYNQLKDQSFEIQTRTIGMDAWANVSHHLDYKGASSVPEDLRRDFYALSGLFYVADQHFEMFAARSGESQEEARKEVESTSNEMIEINLDTVEAFFLKRFSDRKHAARSAISEFVDEIAEVGYEDLRELEDDIDRAWSTFESYEETHNRRFFDVGAARISLAMADKEYSELKYPEDPDFLEFNVWNEVDS